MSIMSTLFALPTLIFSLALYGLGLYALILLIKALKIYIRNNSNSSKNL